MVRPCKYINESLTGSEWNLPPMSHGPIRGFMEWKGLLKLMSFLCMMHQEKCTNSMNHILQKKFGHIENA